jgi:hypothetical protein
MSSYVTSIVFDHDMVPRATTKSAFFLLDDIAQCKWRERAAADVAGAVGSGLSMIGASGLGEKFSSKILSAGERPGAAPEAEAPSSATARVESKQKIESCPPMLPAGRCLHIHRTSLSGGKKFSSGSKTVTLPGKWPCRRFPPLSSRVYHSRPLSSTITPWTSTSPPCGSSWAPAPFSSGCRST